MADQHRPGSSRCALTRDALRQNLHAQFLYIVLFEHLLNRSPKLMHDKLCVEFEKLIIFHYHLKKCKFRYAEITY